MAFPSFEAEFKMYFGKTETETDLLRNKELKYALSLRMITKNKAEHMAVV